MTLHHDKNWLMSKNGISTTAQCTEAPKQQYKSSLEEIVSQRVTFGPNAQMMSLSKMRRK